MTTITDVFNHHFSSILAKDLDGIVEDYASDATLFTPTAVMQGADAIREFMTGFMELLTPEFMSEFKLDSQEIDGEYAYITWNVGAAAPLGTDTFHIVDGKIVMQSFAAYMPS